MRPWKAPAIALAVALLATPLAIAQLGIPGNPRASGIPLHSHHDIATGGPIRFVDLDFTGGNLSAVGLLDTTNIAYRNRTNTFTGPPNYFNGAVQFNGPGLEPLSIVSVNDANSHVGLWWAQTGSITSNLQLPDYPATALAATDYPQAWSALQRYYDNTWKIGDDGDISKAFQFSLGGATTGKTMTLVSAHTADRSDTLPNVSTKLAGLGAAQTFYADQTLLGNTTLHVTAGTGTATATGLLLDDGSGSGFLGEFQTSTLTDFQAYAFPNASGAVSLRTNAETVTNKTLGTSCIGSCTSVGTGFHFRDTGTNTKRLYVDVSGATGSNGLVVTGNARSYALKNEVTPTVVLKTGTDANATGQTADIGSTTLVTPPAAGMYRISYYVADTAADITAGIVTLTLSWTDDVGATTATATQTLTATGRTSGTVVAYVASGSLSYATTHTGAFSAAQYALRIRVEALQ